MEVLYGRSSEAAIFSRALQLSVSKSDIIKKVNSEWISAVVLKLYYETRKLKNSFEKILGLIRFGSCQKLYELCESCHRNPGEILKWKSFEHWQTIYLYICCFGPVTWQSTLISNFRRLIQPYTTTKKLAFYIPLITYVTSPESKKYTQKIKVHLCARFFKRFVK